MVAAVETGVIVLILIALTHRFFRVGSRAHGNFLVLGAIVLMIVHAAGFHFRWQMTPAYLVAAILLVVLLSGVRTGKTIRLTSFGIGVLLLSLSFGSSIGFPVRSLPAPEGPHPVGISSLNRAYTPGSKTGGDSSSARRLNLTIWYPATIEDERRHARETLWSELNSPEHFPKLERFFTAYLKNIETHSFRAAAIVSDHVERPVLIYNHALLSTASDNTLLMEFLASHGYVVIGIRHPDQRNEYAFLQENLSEEEKIRDQKNFKKLGEDIDRKTRAELALQVYRASTTLPVIVKRRALDTKYVLDNLASVLRSIPGCSDRPCFNKEKIGLVGLSLGGAVATEVCKSDHRCRVAVNLDGGIVGTNIQASVTVPYLMLYSERNEGGNDFLKEVSGETYEEHTIEGALHLDFHDATFVLPALRWFGLLGKIGGVEMTHQKNNTVLKFVNENL